MNDNVQEKQMTSEELEDTLTSVTSLDWDDRTAMTPNTIDSTDPDCLSPTDPPEGTDCDRPDCDKPDSGKPDCGKPDCDKTGQNNNIEKSNIEKSFPPANNDSLHQHHNSSPRLVTNGDVPSQQPHMPEKSSKKSSSSKDKVSHRVDDLILLEQLKNLGEESHV